MAEDWTPDTARVREWYATWPVTSIGTRVVPEHLAEFDRWLAVHDAEVAAKAWSKGYHGGVLDHCDAIDCDTSRPNPYRTDPEEKR